MDNSPKKFPIEIKGASDKSVLMDFEFYTASSLTWRSRKSPSKRVLYNRWKKDLIGRNSIFEENDCKLVFGASVFSKVLSVFCNHPLMDSVVQIEGVIWR